MNTKNKFFSAKGMSLVELSFLLPVVFLFIFAGVEFSRTLRVKILAQNLSREFANTLVRECVGFASTDTTGITDCINRFQSSIAVVANDLAPGTRVYGSIFRNPTTATIGLTNVCQTNGPLPTNSGSPASDFPTRIHSGGTTCTSGGPFALDDTVANRIDLTASLAVSGVICVAEVYVPYAAILGFIPGYFRYNPTSFYAATTI